MKNYIPVLLCACMALAGCGTPLHTPPPYTTPHKPVPATFPAPPLPPVPDIPFAGKGGRMAETASSVTLEWNNYGDTSNPFWISGLAGSTNMTSWYFVTNVPLSGTCRVTVPTRSPREFFKAFNWFSCQPGVLPPQIH